MTIKITFQIFIGTMEKLNLEIINTGHEGYEIHANYYMLAASYEYDYGCPIKIDGSVFNEPRKYKVKTEITGMILIILFLPEILKYEHNIRVR